MAEASLSLDQALALFDYEPASGSLTWRAKHRRIQIGQPAGYLHAQSGDWRISIHGVKYQVRQLVWLIEHGAWPSTPLCHSNGDRSDHRISNLAPFKQVVKQKPTAGITAEQLRELLIYDPETGIFTRNDGEPAGTTHATGYIDIRVDGLKYRAHRLAWLYMTGSFPVGVVDHRDGARANNRWNNLRDVTQFVNMQNQRLPRADSRSGLLGVTAHQGRWRASIKVDGRRIYLGTYQEPEEAQAAYLSAKRLRHAGCTL